MRIADVQLSFPFILLAMTINAIVGLGLRNIILSLSAAGWVVYARVVRGEVLSVKQRDYVQATAALGMSRTRLVVRHMLANVAPSIIVVASLQFSSFIVAEAAISFLGFGIQPPTPAWGSMLSESRDFVYVAWWLAAFPGAALASRRSASTCSATGSATPWTRSSGSERLDAGAWPPVTSSPICRG